MKAKYQRGKKSVYQYLRMTSIVNPHASISLVVMDKEGEIIEEGNWVRTSNKLPRVVEEIKPHPHGIQLGTLQRMLRESTDRRMTSFLKHNFFGSQSKGGKGDSWDGRYRRGPNTKENQARRSEGDDYSVPDCEASQATNGLPISY